MSGVNTLRRTTEYVVEWAELEDVAPPVEETLADVELLRVVRVRIEGARRVEPKPVDPIDAEAMLGEPLF
jgi:hypothetical protein